MTTTLPVFLLHQIVDAEGKEVGANVEGEIAVRVKPDRPIGLFSGYYVRMNGTVGGVAQWLGRRFVAGGLSLIYA